MRTVFKILIWLVIAAWFVAVMGFVGGEMEEVICSHVDIVLKDSLRNSFVSGADIRAILEKYDGGIQGYPVNDINTSLLEKEIEKDACIKNAEVYFDVTGRLSVDIYQREPLVRIMPEDGRGFYLDREGHFLPLTPDYTAYVMLASGNIRIPDKINNLTSISEFNEKQKAQYKTIIDLYDFSRYVDDHPFWSSQIVQVYVNDRGEYELIPRVGAHQILLGDMNDFRKKLRNLETLYEQGLSSQGWNNYDKINLKYLNQVICTKR